MKTQEIIDHLDSCFRPEYQESYDNSGFLVGDPESEYTGTLIALDITSATVDEAIDNGLSLIVSHHPLIFNGLKRITNDNADGKMITRLIKNDISVYAAHTNLDNLPWGVNGILAQKLGLIDCHILRPLESDSQAIKQSSNQANSIGAGMVGILPHPTPVMDFLGLVKERLALPVVRTSQFDNHNSELIIEKVAICGGSGASLIPDAIAAEADIFLTGDLKYHDFQKATDKTVLADIGHYESEQFAKEIFYNVISEKFSSFACRISEHSKSYVNYI